MTEKKIYNNIQLEYIRKLRKAVSENLKIKMDIPDLYVKFFLNSLLKGIMIFNKENFN